MQITDLKEQIAGLNIDKNNERNGHERTIREVFSRLKTIRVVNSRANKQEAVEALVVQLLEDIERGSI